MQVRIEHRLAARHRVLLQEYLGAVAASAGDNPRLQELARQIGEVEIALDRLARREYGACLACGRLIGPHRLLQMPLADRCARCGRDARPPAN